MGESLTSLSWARTKDIWRASFDFADENILGEILNLTRFHEPRDLWIESKGGMNLEGNNYILNFINL